ncbi:uncharacterized protein C8Q71DRAFT_861178 [Rhodofomes roseus]|uniref:Uncharacterized protein n=1 Tax=Rhodofomes roseus TaxID=34475 RepID=A0ABQ8K675_9APHY|nr:uncharacterized protein C8Q71DRAFT_861178 [Rhodofomes roseus]KAH9832284.1 hypothetical protein C8Q71DRAFT_861178 [Rhodofomes roseus]
MAYAYYQSSVPRWGTQDFQFTRPPLPRWQPQPHWSGMDYYRAHAAYDDPGLFQSVMGRLAVAIGSGFHEARHWHRRVYSGQVNLGTVLPTELGSAAAYEAYRYWKYHHPLYELLDGDRERERDAMMGMAVAEATHLWQYTGRPFDNLGLRESCETAAATASQIADKVLGYGGDYSDYESRSSYGQQDYHRSRYDDGHAHRQPRTLRRWSSANSMNGAYLSGGTPAPYGSASPYNVASGVVPQVAQAMTPVPGYAQSAGGFAVLPGTTAGYMPAAPPTYGVQPAQYGAYQAGYPVVPGAMAGAVAPNAYGAAYAPGGATPGYGAAGYGGYPGQIPAGSTIVLRRPSKHHHHHHQRARSVSFNSRR